MAFDFLGSLDTTTLFLLLIIFILFVLSMKRVFSIIKNAIFISVAAILFPVVMNSFFGFSIPTDTDSIVSFILLGLGLYFVYMIGKSVYKMLKITERVARKAVPKVERKEGRKEKEDTREEDNKHSEREKNLEKREKELSKQEREVRWKAALETSKSKQKKHDEKDYVIIRDKSENEEKKKSSHAEPLPVIEHKKKRSKKQD